MSQPSRESLPPAVERPNLWRDLREGVAVVDRITRGWLGGFGRRRGQMIGPQDLDATPIDPVARDMVQHIASNVVRVDFRRGGGR